MADPELNHHHNEELEGPLPPGFPELGREGKVRNIYLDEAAGRICLIASDRVSAFDVKSPTPIPGKGVILNDIASRELVAAQAAAIPTWFEGVPEDNPRAAVGRLAVVKPIEVIFRNYMTGSMWREYQKSEGFVGFDLPKGLREWQVLMPPMFTPSTKSKDDENFHPRDVVEKTGVSRETLWDMEELGRLLFKLGMERASARGLVLVDTKYEMGTTEDGELIVLDEVHTPDSSRFALAEGFESSLLAGQPPKSYSKEYLRQIQLLRANQDMAGAKALMAEPLDPWIVDELLKRYNELHTRFTAEV